MTTIKHLICAFTIFSLAACGDEMSEDFSVTEPEVGSVTSPVWDGIPANRRSLTRIIISGESSCTGVFINQNTILTAAHCTNEGGIPYSTACTVYPNGESPSYGTPCRVTPHPDYGGLRNPGNDIAIIELTSVNYSRLGMRLWSGNIARYENLLFFGYGVTGSGRNDSGTLRTDPDYDTLVVDRRVGDYFVVTANRNVLRICSGDSGGPGIKLHNGFDMAVGLASTIEVSTTAATACARYKGRQEFASIRPKIAWIQSQIGRCNRFGSSTNGTEYYRCW